MRNNNIFRCDAREYEFLVHERDPCVWDDNVPGVGSRQIINVSITERRDAASYILVDEVMDRRHFLIRIEILLTLGDYLCLQFCRGEIVYQWVIFAIIFLQPLGRFACIDFYFSCLNYTCKKSTVLKRKIIFCIRVYDIFRLIVLRKRADGLTPGDTTINFHLK